MEGDSSSILIYPHSRTNPLVLLILFVWYRNLGFFYMSLDLRFKSSAIFPEKDPEMIP